jgi:hypothetical protein
MSALYPSPARPSFGEIAYHELYRDDFEPREHYRPLWATACCRPRSCTADATTARRSPASNFPLISERAGWFVSRRGVGEWLRAGERIGAVYDGFAGDQTAEILAPVAGLLSGIRRQPLLCEGDLLARLLTREEFESVPETYLMRHGQ